MHMANKEPLNAISASSVNGLSSSFVNNVKAIHTNNSVRKNRLVTMNAESFELLVAKLML